MEQFPKFVASRLAREQLPAEMHPDADTLTAFAEQRLRPAKRNPVLAHLAVCRECRDVLALAAVKTPVSQPIPGKLWNWRWAAAAVAVCLLTVTVVWRSKPVEHPSVVVESKPEVVTQPAAIVPPASPTKAEPLAKSTVAKKAIRPQLEVREATAVPPPAKELPKPLGLPAVPQADAASGQISPPIQPAPPPPLSQPVEAFGIVAQRQLARQDFLPAKQRNLWSVHASPGVLRKSNDGGQSWTPVPVDNVTNFSALSVAGSNVWVGGETGSLFHSTDNGLTWKEVTVSDGIRRMQDTVTRIKTQGQRVILLRTNSAQDWLSTDGGITWRKQN